MIGFDVTVPGDHHGLVTPDHAAWLDAILAAAPEVPTLLVTHQPPFRTGITAIDEHRCCGDDLLAEVLLRHPQVIRLLSGHFHRFMLKETCGRPALTAPSTAISLALRLTPGAEPASITEPPALLLHHWTGGQLTTHLQPLGAFSGPCPFL